MLSAKHQGGGESRSDPLQRPDSENPPGGCETLLSLLAYTFKKKEKRKENTEGSASHAFFLAV